MAPLLPSSDISYHTDDEDSPTRSTLTRKSLREPAASASAAMSDGVASKPQKKSSSTQQKQKVKKSVDFNPKVRVRKISTHRRYSDEERASMWYSADEFKEIRQGAIDTVKKMMKKIPVDKDPNDCSRGLESKTPKKNKIRQARKGEILWTVLSELMSCQESGKSYQRAAAIYTSVSRTCYEEAAQRGALDAIEAWSER